MKWEKKWVYTNAGPRQVDAVHHPELGSYVIKINHSMREAMPEHAVFNTSDEAVQAVKDGKIKLPEAEQ